MPSANLNWTDYLKAASIYAVAAAIPLGIVWIGLHHYWLIFDVDRLSDDHGEWGQFGDFIGGIVNPSVGLVTIFLLVWTLRSQQRELREQRTQLEKQSAEQTFFTWLNAINEAIKNMHVIVHGRSSITEYLGHKVLDHKIRWDDADQQELDEIEWAILNSDETTRPSELKRLSDFEIKNWNDRGQDFEIAAVTPTRLLVELIRFVTKNPVLLATEKERYMKVLRASISKAQAHQLFRTICHNEDKGTLRDAAAEYELFRFLYTTGEYSPLIAALLRYDAHKLPQTCFHPQVLKDLKDDIPKLREFYAVKRRQYELEF